MSKVIGTEWEMTVMLAGMYGLRLSEIIGLRWQNVDLQKSIFGVVEQSYLSICLPEQRPSQKWHRQNPMTASCLLQT